MLVRRDKVMQVSLCMLWFSIEFELNSISPFIFPFYIHCKTFQQQLLIDIMVNDEMYQQPAQCYPFTLASRTLLICFNAFFYNYNVYW